MAFNGAYNNRGRGGSRTGLPYAGRNYNPNHSNQNTQNNQNNNQNQANHGNANRGGHNNSGFRQTFAAPVDKNDYKYFIK